MLSFSKRHRGFTLIEVLVTLSIAAILMALGAPSFSNWLANSRIRLTAESVLSGLQLAKSEAASRNTQVRFQLTTSTDDNCTISNTGASWVVSLVDDAATFDVTGKCGHTPSDTTAPGIIVSRTSSDGGGTTVVDSAFSKLTFNGFSRQTPTPTSSQSVWVRSTDENLCAEKGGALTCLYVVVAPSGQLRMCNAQLTSTDPQSCGYAP